MCAPLLFDQNNAKNMAVMYHRACAHPCGAAVTPVGMFKQLNAAGNAYLAYEITAEGRLRRVRRLLDRRARQVIIDYITGAK